MCRIVLILSLLGTLCPAQPAQPALPARIVGPLTVSANPNYFQDASGAVLILNGSHTWNNLQDWGSNGSLQPMDFGAYVKFLTAHGHNFTLLWYTEFPKFHGFPSTTTSPPDLTVAPHPWLRTGPGMATDGGPKFDLTHFDPQYFDRLRTRTRALLDAGIYAGIYLFTGEWQNIYRSSTDGYPLTGANNINGIDDEYTDGKKGTGSVAMTAPNAITRIQDAYVEHVVDTLNDLPNVLWVVSEEAPAESKWWNDHHIAHLRAYESQKPHQHPIGFGTFIGAPDTLLYDSDADWVKPQVRVSPTRSCGSGKPRCKVNVNDSDHSYWELWNDTPQKNRNYAWENFMTGNQVMFMDPYVVHYPRQARNLCVSPVNAICSAPDARYDNLRDNLGYIVKYSRRLKLAAMTPNGALSSTGYCLVQAPSSGAAYLVYAPEGGPFAVDLSGLPEGRQLAVEWFDPSTGAVVHARTISAGAALQRFTAPFSGDAVLYLSETAARAGNPPASR